jgi:flagellin
MAGSGSTAVGESGTVSINGYSVSISATDTFDTALSKLQEGAAKAGVNCFVTDDTTPDKANNGADYAGYKPNASGTLLTFATKGYGSDESLTIECAEPLASKLGLSAAAVSGGVTDTGEDVQAEFTSPRGNFADSAVISTDGTVITVTDVNNRKMKLDVPGDVAAGAVDGVTITEEVTDIGTMSIHIGANQDQTIELDIPAVTSYTLGTDTINVMTSVTSQKAIAQVDEAINTVNAVRSKIGAYSNRFEHTRANLSVSSENAESALSTMMDTEMADEMTTYTSLNVLTQAATSILSQANERPSTVLQILQ